MSAAKPIRSVQFRREREASWKALEDIIEHANKHGVRKLSAEQATRLPHLYRATLSSLSVARTISLDTAMVNYLESLVARAYFVVYGTRERFASSVKTYFAQSLPQAFRRRLLPFGISLAFGIFGAIVAYVLTSKNSDYYYTFVGDMAQGRSPASTTAELRDALYDQSNFSESLATFAASLFSHNSRIGILSFALGFVVGLPTIYLMFYNGLVLGAFVQLYTSRGLSSDIWGWLLPHGITELLAVVICGAAGLAIAQAIIFPGQLSRLANLKQHGRDAALLVVGAVAMLFIAGIIEGILRQTISDITFRYCLATSTAIFWTWYFGFCGRDKSKLPPVYAVLALPANRGRGSGAVTSLAATISSVRGVTEVRQTEHVEGRQ
jgi:uncharacterized membrane protein SpoIIM required for sporulation